MDLPMTSPAPWEESLASPMETLFPELAPAGMRPVEVQVTVPGEDGRQVIMHLMVPEGILGALLPVALAACRGVPDFELTARPATAG